MCKFFTYSTFIACHIMRSIQQFTWMSFFFLFYPSYSLSCSALSWAMNILFHGIENIHLDICNICLSSSQELVCSSIQSISNRTVLVNIRIWCTQNLRKQRETKGNETKRYETKITKYQAKDGSLLNVGCSRNFKLLLTDKIWNIKWFTFSKVKPKNCDKICMEITNHKGNSIPNKIIC